jgi:hypothetical protein
MGFLKGISPTTTGEPCTGKLCKHGSEGDGWKRAQPVVRHCCRIRAYEPRRKTNLASRPPNEADRSVTTVLLPQDY